MEIGLNLASMSSFILNILSRVQSDERNLSSCNKEAPQNIAWCFFWCSEFSSGFWLILCFSFLFSFLFLLPPFFAGPVLKVRLLSDLILIRFQDFKKSPVQDRLCNVFIELLSCLMYVELSLTQV